MSREAAFAITFAILVAFAAAVLMMGSGGPGMLIGLGVLALAAVAFAATAAFSKNRRAGSGPAGKFSPRDWWVALAALAGALQIVAILVETVRDPNPSNLAALGVVGGLGALILAGAWVRTRSRNAGDWMIVIGILPWLGLWWMIVPTVVALVIMVMAIRDTLQGRTSQEASA